MKFVSPSVWLVARTEELQRIKKKILQNGRKRALKGPKIKISKNKKLRFFLMSQGVLCQKIRFLGQKPWPVAGEHTDRHTHTHRGFNYWVPYQGFSISSFCLWYERSNNSWHQWFLVTEGNLLLWCFPQELKIHSENEKEVINAEVNGKEARQTCVDERVVKQKEFFQPIKISNLKNNS